MTEEEQIKLLEQYEMEKKSEKKSTKMKKPIGEKILFKQESPKKNLEKNEMKTEEKSSKLIKEGSTVNVDTSSSNSSTDGDWEKIPETEKLN